MLRKTKLAIWLLLVTLGFSGAVGAKEFSLPKVRIAAQVNPDGSLLVTEERTYRFSGRFTWASMWLPTTGAQTIESVTVTEGQQQYTESTSQAPGTFEVASTAARTDVKWFYEADNEERAFAISYLVRNAVRVYTDVAELYWQFIGEGWDVPTKQAEVVVTLPSAAPTGSVRVWGHGPLQGTVRLLDPSSALWEVDDLPAHTFLEARITFPPSLVPLARVRENGAGLPAILAEEETWAARANRIRANAQLDMRLALLVLGCVAVASVLFWSRYSRPFRSDFQGTYFRDLPTDHQPAVLGILWRGHSNAQDISATLLDLVRRKHLTVEPLRTTGWRRQTDFILASPKQQANDSSLRQPERLLLKLLFEDVAGWLPAGKPVTTLSIKRYARKRATSFSAWYSSWERAASSAADKYKFMDSSNRTARVAAGLVGAALVAVSIAVFAASSFRFTAGSLLVGALAAILCAALSSRRTLSAQTEYTKWQAFRRYLRHFSNIKEAPILSVAIWEHYLVYAVVLGVAKDVIRQLQVLAPQLASDPGYASSWLFMGMSPSDNHAIGSLCSSFVSSVQVAMSPSSSGSGGGGGFSSGGGGGGGGGGGSAG